MVNFGLLTAEICWRVWGTPEISTGFASWQRYCTASSSGCEPKLAALNRGRHLCSAGRPSRWALAHILVVDFLWLENLNVCVLQDRLLWWCLRSIIRCYTTQWLKDPDALTARVERWNHMNKPTIRIAPLMLRTFNVFFLSNFGTKIPILVRRSCMFVGFCLRTT